MRTFYKMNKGFHIIRGNFNCEVSFILSILIVIPTTASYKYGPSILNLLRPSVLSPIQEPPPQSMTNDVRFYTEKTINLEDFPNYAAVLPMANGRSWIKSEELLDILGKDSPNEGFLPFYVTPPKDYGIMVVIQELQIPAFNTFNQSILLVDDSGRIVECFSKFVFQIEGKSPVEVCGRTNDQLPFPSSVIDGVGPRSFIVPAGKSISVGFIYRDEALTQSPTLSKQVPHYDMGYFFRASIAFTAYKDCPHGPPFYNENNEKLWPCDIPQSSREAVAACIREELFCDNIINCGMHDTKEFAVDERFCREKLTSSSNVSNPNSTYSIAPSSERQILVDTSRLEEAIKHRVISNNRHYDNSNMIMYPYSGKGSHYAPEPIDKGDTLGHPAFVALIVVITIICVLMVGLIFRYCCNPCVGKRDAYAGSSNPDAVARFHERANTDTHGQPGRGHGVSLEGIFKPAEDLPPSYADLFPQDSEANNQTGQKEHVPTFSPEEINPNNAVDTVIRLDESPPVPVYSLPTSTVTQESSSFVPASRSWNRATNSSGSSNQSYFLNPTYVHEVLPENSNVITSFDGKIIKPSCSVNNDRDSIQRLSHQDHQAYGVDST